MQNDAHTTSSGHIKYLTTNSVAYYITKCIGQVNIQNGFLNKMSMFVAVCDQCNDV